MRTPLLRGEPKAPTNS